MVHQLPVLMKAGGEDGLGGVEETLSFEFKAAFAVWYDGNNADIRSRPVVVVDTTTFCEQISFITFVAAGNCASARSSGRRP